jgi:hypothetical protein
VVRGKTTESGPLPDAGKGWWPITRGFGEVATRPLLKDLTQICYAGKSFSCISNKRLIHTFASSAMDTLGLLRIKHSRSNRQNFSGNNQGGLSFHGYGTI